jgi:hypothetical protein
MSALWFPPYGSVVASRDFDLAINGGFEGSPCAEDALAFGELRAAGMRLRRRRWKPSAVPARLLELGRRAAAGAALAVAIVIGSSRRRRGQRRIAERLVRRGAGALGTVGPVGLQAGAAGLTKPRLRVR